MKFFRRSFALPSREQAEWSWNSSEDRARIDDKRSTSGSPTSLYSRVGVLYLTGYRV